jgi:hypothetical protein
MQPNLPDPSAAGRQRVRKPGAEIVLICNPRAGGRWKELAEILDSEECQHVRRIVTDSVEDIAPAIADLGHEAKLLCIYGGDGTIQRILDRLSPTKHEQVSLAFIGGGTMNVTARWCGLDRSPADNFKEVVRGYVGGELLFKEINLLDIHNGPARYRGFTFGMGPIVRLLDAYERGAKGKLGALGTAGRGIMAALTGFPSDYRELLEQMHGQVTVDDEVLPYERFSAVFCNVTGQINPGVVPFVEKPTRDTFHYAAYAVTSREFTMNVAGLARGWLPVEPKQLVRPDRVVRRLADPSPLKTRTPSDPRYVNRNAAHMEVLSDEQLFTVDGEILQAADRHFDVSLGLQVRLAVSSRQTVAKAGKLLARRYLGRE